MSRKQPRRQMEVRQLQAILSRLNPFDVLVPTTATPRLFTIRRRPGTAFYDEDFGSISLDVQGSLWMHWFGDSTGPRYQAAPRQRKTRKNAK